MEKADSSVFFAFIDPHVATIERVVRSWARSEADAQDLRQEVMLQLWRAYPRFRGESRPRTWIYRVAMNVAISGGRSRRRRRNLESQVERDSRLRVADSQGIAVGHVAHRDTQWFDLLELVRSLSDVERALVIGYLEGLDYVELGDVLGISPNAVGTRLTRLKARLRAQIELEHVEEEHSDGRSRS